MTQQEVRLWMILRGFRKSGFHFRRQVPIERFIVDFACLKHKLVVELDGGQHGLEGHTRRDSMRDQVLTGMGFRILRFWNMDVDRNLPGVVEVIADSLRISPPPALRAGPSPAGRDGADGQGV